MTTMDATAAIEAMMDALNQRAYDSSIAINAYSRGDRLMAAEAAVISRLSAELRGRRLLDLGVGGGRTARALVDISHDYTGVDYSPRLVETARLRTGISTIYCCDARDMRSFFADASFDFVLFSFNGIDYMPHNARMAALAEIARVLKPGGWFFFSSHNRAALGSRPLEVSPAALKEVLKKLILLPRRWRLRRLEMQTNEYAILNDSGLHYSLLTYYIDIAAQIAQLTAAGFTAIEAYDVNGVRVTEDNTSPFVHYLARRNIPCPR